MLQGIDYTGKPIGNIDFIEASWDRNWSEAGDFMGIWLWQNTIV